MIDVDGYCPCNLQDQGMFTALWFRFLDVVLLWYLFNAAVALYL